MTLPQLSACSILTTILIGVDVSSSAEVAEASAGMTCAFASELLEKTLLSLKVLIVEYEHTEVRKCKYARRDTTRHAAMDMQVA